MHVYRYIHMCIRGNCLDLAGWPIRRKQNGADLFGFLYLVSKALITLMSVESPLSRFILGVILITLLDKIGALNN
jgi:hypothetical protein